MNFNLGKSTQNLLHKRNIDLTDNSFWEKITDSEWRKRCQMNRSKLLPRYNREDFITHQTPPSTLAPTTIYTENNMIFQEGSSQIETQNLMQIEDHEYKEWLLNNIKVQGNFHHLINKKVQGTIIQ